MPAAELSARLDPLESRSAGSTAALTGQSDFAALWGGHSCLRPSFQLGSTHWKAGPPARQPLSGAEHDFDGVTRRAH